MSNYKITGVFLAAMKEAINLLFFSSSRTRSACLPPRWLSRSIYNFEY
jgi:hypothetical protein